MGIIFIVKCFLLYYSLTCVKNLVESSETSPANPNPGTQGGTSVTTPAAGGTEPETKTGVELSLKATSGTNEFDHKKDGKVVTYTAKDNFKFSLIKDGDNNIWKTENDSDYANKVVSAKRHSGILDVTIHLVNGGSKLFVNDYFYNQWKEIDITKVNPKFVNINYQHESHAYKNELKNNIRTFTAKYGFAFKGANEFVGGIKVEIWKTDDESEYANKIVNEGGNRVIIHIGEGTGASTKGFSKGTDGNWTADSGCSRFEQSNSEEKEKEASADPDGTTGGLASGESSDAGLVSVSSGEAGEEGSTSGGDASLASTDASPEGSVATPANEVSTSGGSSNEGAGADAAENLTAQPAGGADAGSLGRGSTQSSGRGSHVKGEPVDGSAPEASISTQNVQEKKKVANVFFTDLNKVVNELSQGIDGTNDLAELDSKMREAAYKLSVELSKFLRLL